MSRLAASVVCDLRLQLRHGLVIAGVGVMAFLVALASPFEATTLRPFVPLFVFFQSMTTAFFFIAALVLFEKAEGSLEALVVTPLRPVEYLGSKIVSLGLLAAGEIVLVIALTVGLDLSWGPLALGLAGISALYSLAGFIAVARFDSITDFLLPGAAAVTLLQLPSLGAAGIWPSPLWWLWPSQPFLVALRGSIEPLSSLEWIYVATYGPLCLAVAMSWAGRSFARFVVRREGSRA